jgi:hypothetical protein
MHRLIILVTLMLSFCGSGAQVIDDFGDGGVEVRPTWIGDDSLFRVNSAYQLQNKGTVAKEICLSTPFSANGSLEWNLWCRFNLSPSTSNFCRFYLMSDVADLKGNLNGYYIQFGGVTGNTDSITLYKQKGSSRTRIIGGRPSTVSKTNNLVRVRVTKDEAGNWELYADTTGGFSMIQEGKGRDTEFTQSSYTGFWMRYTSGNATAYFFDDLYAGPLIIDTVPPRIDSVNVLSRTRIAVILNENVEASSALDRLNYSVSGIGHPLAVTLAAGRYNTVWLEVPALSGAAYFLEVTGIKDIYGNKLIRQQVPFSYGLMEASLHDVLISELLPDPSPPKALPEHEFIELYNRSAVAVPLKEWTLSDGTSTTTFPDIVLAPGSFLIVCATAHVPLFSSWGRTVGVASLPSLNNAADIITLRNQYGKLIHQVAYDLSWYGDKTKADGGWTLEMLNPFDLCKGRLNFHASDNPEGGSPGKANSGWNTLPDTIPPVVKTISVSGLEIIIVFNEQMDSLSLLETNIALPDSIVITGKQIAPATHDTLILYTAHLLAPNTAYQVIINGARDCNGNPMYPDSQVLTRFVPGEAAAYDILINELMADPDPPVQLPDAEYIELYNRSGKIISLKGWKLSDAGSVAVLPAYMLFPDSFVVFTSLAAGKFPGGIKVFSVAGFPSLGNDADAVTLSDAQGRVIHHMAYTSAFYKDPVKKNGGWSLELMDPLNPCGGEHVYIASTHPSGGTPGKPNAVLRTNRDKYPPALQKAYPLSVHELRLTFSESIDSLTLSDAGNYHVNYGIGYPSRVHIYGPAYREAVLVFADSMTIGKAYRVIASNVNDCAGNRILYADHADFGIPEPYDSFDIVINEILFAPAAGGTDYVEICNRTGNMIDLKKLFIANATSGWEIRTYYPIAPEGFILFPHAYAVVTADPSAVQAHYNTPDPGNIIRCSMPAFNNDEGRCILMDASGKRYDQFHYTENMHFAMLSHRSGVSLERIDMNRPSQDHTNWTSASSTSGFGTPTARNSQYAGATGGEGLLSVSPEVFSPDGDGYRDIVSFGYSLPVPGYMGNLYIYDASGNMVKHLMRNELLGTEGTVSWDGITDNGRKASIGIYLCRFEAFALTGDVRSVQKTIVVGGKL